MALAAKSLIFTPTRVNTSHVRLGPLPKLYHNNFIDKSYLKLKKLSFHRHVASPSPTKASPDSDAIVTSGEDDPENGVSLGTVKLPGNVDIQRFEMLLFQWGNSLFQGANLPLTAPLKVDKIAGGARLGFITIGDGTTDVPVYIDCLVFPASETSGPIFRAIRNGRQKDKPTPDESRIMNSLLQALKKSIQIARF